MNTNRDDEDMITPHIGLLSVLPLVRIFSFLEHHSLGICAQVNHLWNAITDEDELWKSCIGSTCCGMSCNRFISTQVTTQAHLWKALFKETMHLLDEEKLFNLLKEGIEQSSADYPDQEISNTLSRNHRFWSSKGSGDIESGEHLVYKLLQPVCIVQKVHLFAYKGLYASGPRTYTPQFFKVSVGFSPHLEDMHFTSEKLLFENTEAMQTCEFKEPQIGGYLRLDLIGRRERQPSDNLYYTVLRYVAVIGVPLEELSEKPLLSSSLLNFALASKYFTSSPTKWIN